jgi:UDP-N-acetylmuramoyl-tripeptide--D-alanyl-D-alanine ligase
MAIRGERHDGHDYLREAATAGAGVLIVHSSAGDLPGGVGILLVDDTRDALGRLAAAWRQTLSRTTVIAVTGSCGKTTVKKLLDEVLSSTRRGSAAPLSFNNDIGLPLAILAADPADEYLILEIGANSPGEVDHLSRIARPDIGVITMIGRAHLAGFGSVASIATEKATMLEHLQGPRVAVVNADCPGLRNRYGGAGTVVLFGENADADVRLTGWAARQGGGRMEVDHATRYDVGLPGRHNAVNALAAVAVARNLGTPEPLIAVALAGCGPVAMRLSRHDVGEVTFYNDAYNANPESMAASLESFADLAADAPRRVVVLGDMLELGTDAAEQHREIGRRIVDLDRRVPLDRLVLVGEMSSYTAEPLLDCWPSQRVTLLDDLDQTNAAAVVASLIPGDAVLLKGSRALRLETVIEAACALGTDA